MKLTKQTSKGEAVIEVVNGTATSTINGISTGISSGMVIRFYKPIGDKKQFVAGICGIALTKEEAAEINKMLEVKTPVAVRPETGRAAYIQTMRQAYGDINQFAKGGAL